MVITRTPFRISFFGGGTDYPIWYLKNGGSVISTAINKYCYIKARYLPPFFPYNYRVSYSNQEYTQTIDEIKHPSVRESLRFMNLRKGVEILHFADIPSLSGMGSSSAFTVGLLNALYTLKNSKISKQKLALKAIHLEQDLIQENVGSQDQVITSYGGFNKILFNKNGSIKVEPLMIKPKRLKDFHYHFVLLFTGIHRYSSNVTRNIIKNVDSKFTSFEYLSSLTEEAYKFLKSNDQNYRKFGKLLHEAWLVKKDLARNVSSNKIDELYKQGIKNGAWGGKILGAGGGGFILFSVEPKYKKKFVEKMNLLHVPFEFEKEGSKIIYKNLKQSYEF